MVDTRSARGIKAPSSMTAAKGITSRTSPDALERKLAAIKKPAPKTPAKPAPKKPVKKTPAKNTTTKKPEDLALGANEQLAINTLEGQAETTAALRQYQEEAAKRNLQQSLKTIDRGALDLYKGVSDDYAGRGMLRTGGYVQADDRAYQGVQDQKVSMQNSLMDLLRQNQIESAGEAETLTNQKTDIMQKFLQALMAGKTNKIGQK
jgi:hypothetical protein